MERAVKPSLVHGLGKFPTAEWEEPAVLEP
jgi:hypothetical protein